MLAAYRPQVVIGFGGYVSAPVNGLPLRFEDTASSA